MNPIFRLRPVLFPMVLVALLAAGATLPASGARKAPRASTPPPDDSTLFARLIGIVATGDEPGRGGFVSKEGVPDEAAVELAELLAHEGVPGWRERARRTIEWTWGLYDSVGGGFLHGTRDASHSETSFDKNTKDNALRLENRVDAWLDGRSRADERAVRAILDFFERVLLDGRGGFVAGQIGDRDLVPSANGLAIHAYLTWSAATGETRWRDFALKSIDRVWETEWDPQLGVLHRDGFGNLRAMPQLEDQVEMGRAMVLAAHLAGRAQDLAGARQIGDLLLTRFEDTKNGGMRSQAVPAKDGAVKKASRESGENARASRFLAELAAESGEEKYRTAARRLVAVFAPGIEKPSSECADWALAVWALDHAEFPDRPNWQAAAPDAPTHRIFQVPPLKRGHRGR